MMQERAWSRSQIGTPPVCLLLPLKSLEVKELAAHCFVDGTAYSARVPDAIQRQNYPENWLEQAALTHP